MNTIGFMQGRLVDKVDGKIQAFPWRDWRLEFERAAEHGFPVMEWTLDHQDLRRNPCMTAEGRAEIAGLCRLHRLAIDSMTGDCFMQAPFWKADGEARRALLQEFDDVAAACAAIGVRYLVVPLVDNGSLETPGQWDLLTESLRQRAGALARSGVAVVFETDLAPDDYARLMARLPEPCFGVNYDIGNSASLGFDPREEFAAYGRRIVNVHVKDRVRGGSTVPLGSGDADFAAVFAGLRALGYGGNLILQTARADDGRHAEVLSDYRRFVVDGWERARGS
ncbi:sugar phosphate isomerase/epimerase family protein [Chromobacterium sphagni]|uniref:Xylose isomerase n=1 Tax=Chromobacterium sphagni TaxID=1903179 RepID=A0A1S1X089_9NEIS|nr:sugar phosphate isomerase/epimerase family protein [Chromobacterium sphagni]OHX12810.1 xylose isomerase [Chromobacterium sphagni]OHX17671.1 xylose isomerase [Chromobacterium sphagni]